MNDNHLQQIFKHYIDKFEYVNNAEHQEYYKWQIAKIFHDEMDKVLASPAEEFAAKLYELKKQTFNLIDSYTTPFYGLVKFAENDPEAVRSMFLELFADDGGDLKKRGQKIAEFLRKSHALRQDLGFEDSYLYKDDVHSVTGYLFLYDPDNNYIFKSTHAQIFADCVEFYDDWGSGDTVDIEVYYRMCDQLVEAIKSNKELVATDNSRFENGWGVDSSTLYPDPEKHILAFDIIYCCSSYELFDGITFVRPKSKERQLMVERKEKAIQLSENLDRARADMNKLDEAKEYVNSVFSAGKSLQHKKYGEGKIQKNDGTSITVEFPEAGEKQFGTIIASVNGIISSTEPEYVAMFPGYCDILKKDSSIRTALLVTEREFSEYADYLD